MLPSLHQLRVMSEGEEKGKWNCESQFAPAKSTPIEESVLPQYDAQKAHKPTPNETKTDRSTLILNRPKRVTLETETAENGGTDHTTKNPLTQGAEGEGTRNLRRPVV